MAGLSASAHRRPDKYQNLSACPFFHGNPRQIQNCSTVRWYYQNTDWPLERIARHFKVRRQTIWAASKKLDLDWGKRRRHILARQRLKQRVRKKMQGYPWWYQRLQDACWKRGITCMEAPEQNGLRWKNRMILNGRTVLVCGTTRANWTGRSQSAFSSVCLPAPFPRNAEFLLVVRKLDHHPANFFLIPCSEIHATSLQLPTVRVYRRANGQSYRSVSRWWKYQNAWHLLQGA